MGFFDTLFGNKQEVRSGSASSKTAQPSVSKSDNSINLDSVESIIADRIEKLKSGMVSTDEYGWPNDSKHTVDVAIEYKRRGDLATANNYYCEAFKSSALYNSDFVWGWCKIMILAKQWDCLCTLLHYHFVVMVSWNRKMRDSEGEEYFRSYSNFHMVPHFKFDEFHAGEYLRDQVHNPLLDKDSAASRLSEYGGSPYWGQNYHLSQSEWNEFMQLFPLPEL